MVDDNHYQALADRLADTGERFEFGPGISVGAVESDAGTASSSLLWVEVDAGEGVLGRAGDPE